MHVDGRRPQGRPKQRWQDTVNNGLRKTGLQPTDANNRQLWRSSPTERAPHQRDKRQDEEREDFEKEKLTFPSHPRTLQGIPLLPGC